MGRLPGVGDSLRRWMGQPDAEAVSDEDFGRSTMPDAPMQMLLRFTTEAGPRTIIASGIPLRVASAIALEMNRAGHFAEYIDDSPRLTLTARAKKRKNSKASNTQSPKPAMRSQAQA